MVPPQAHSCGPIGCQRQEGGIRRTWRGRASAQSAPTSADPRSAMRSRATRPAAWTQRLIVEAWTSSRAAIR